VKKSHRAAREESSTDRFLKPGENLAVLVGVAYFLASAGARAVVLIEIGVRRR
jgi:hypothetical protein